MDAELELCGESMRLLPERAVFWPARKTLFVADTHWGKDATFRAAAVPIPAEVQEADLARLDRVVRRTEAERLVVLGDLLHAADGYRSHTATAVRRWRDGHRNLAVTVVEGNHDRRAGRPPDDWRLDVVTGSTVDGPFVYCHHPEPDPRGYTLCGHIHPRVTLRDAGRPHGTLPCFWFGPQVGVLPAFSAFTAGQTVRPARSDRVFVLADDAVMRLT